MLRQTQHDISNTNCDKRNVLAVNLYRCHAERSRSISMICLKL